MQLKGPKVLGHQCSTSHKGFLGGWLPTNTLEPNGEMLLASNVVKNIHVNGFNNLGPDDPHFGPMDRRIMHDLSARTRSPQNISADRKYAHWLHLPTLRLPLPAPTVKWP